jgi:hypothetical protein
LNYCKVSFAVASVFVCGLAYAGNRANDPEVAKLVDEYASAATPTNEMMAGKWMCKYYDATPGSEFTIDVEMTLSPEKDQVQATFAGQQLEAQSGFAKLNKGNGKVEIEGVTTLNFFVTSPVLTANVKGLMDGKLIVEFREHVRTFYKDDSHANPNFSLGGLMKCETKQDLPCDDKDRSPQSCSQSCHCILQ